MGLTSFNKRKTLVALALSSSLIHIPAWGVEVSFENPSGPLKTSEASGGDTPTAEDIIIKPTGYISAATTAVTIDSVNTVTIEPDNISAVPPGLTTNGNADTVYATSQGSISVGANSGIVARNGGGQDFAIRLNPAPNFSINNAGSITNEGTGAAIRLDNSSSVSVTNVTGGLISGGDDAIRIVTSSNFLLNNQADATVQGTATGSRTGALEFTGGSGIINNSGIIKIATANSVAGAIYTDAGSATVVVNNLEGGSILAPNSNGIHARDLASPPRYTIDNAGLISAGRNGIDFPKLNTGNITNSATGIINAGLTVDSGIGINLNAGMTGNILNDGAINAKDRGILINGVFTGNLTNNGSITVSGSDDGRSAIWISNSFNGNLTNNGTLSSNGDSTIRLVNNGTGISGDLINTGTITQLGTGNNPFHALQINNNIGGKLDNQGTISSTVANFPTISVTGNVTDGIFNSGTITGVTGNLAVDIQSASDFTQTAGTITGNMETAGLNTTFSGGTLTGNLTLTGGGPNILNLSNTTISGNLEGANATDTINLDGSFTHGGTITKFGNLNLNAGTLTSNGNISIFGGGPGTVTVKNGATFDLNQNLTTNTGATTLTIDAGGVMNVNSGASITNGLLAAEDMNLVNNGTMTISENTTIDINKVTAGANSIFNLSITDTSKLSDIQVDGAGSNVSAGTFNTSLTGDGFIAQDNQFKVITTGVNGITTAGYTIGQPSSLTISFEDASDANNLILKANRAPFQGLTNSPNADAAATAIDAIINNPNLTQDLKLAIAQIDILGTIDEVTAAVEAFLPDTSGGMVEISQDVFNRGLFTVEGRIHEARSWADIMANTMPAGDEPYFGLGAWGKVFASTATQKDLDIFPGYTSTAVGFSTGFDKSFTEDLMLGAAFTFTSAEVEGKQRAPNEIDVNSLQLIGYGSASWGALYLDGLVSAALNSYKSSRMIEIGTFKRVAKANYKAWQYAGKAELGYTIANGKYRIEPIAGIQYTMLDMDGYTESTGGGINLAVQPRNVHDVIGSLGLRFSSLNEYVEALYVPEFRAFLNYDFVRDNILTNENFVSNGALLFETRSAKPDPMTYNLGVALSAYTLNLIFAVNYDISFRKQYFGHYGSFKMRYEW